MMVSKWFIVVIENDIYLHLFTPHETNCERKLNPTLSSTTWFVPVSTVIKFFPLFCNLPDADEPLPLSKPINFRTLAAVTV